MVDVYSADVIDLRELAEYARDLAGSIEDPTEYDDVEALRDEATELIRFAGELANRNGIDTLEDAADAIQEIGDNYEPTLIRDDCFTEYAEQLAEDLDMIPRDAAWPARHIDWKAAADDLRVDYTSVTLAGVDYLIRAW